MDNTTTFNSHRFVKRLVETGMNQQTAEVLTELLTDAIVTKADLKTELYKLEVNLLKWMVGMMIAQTAIIVSLINFLN